MSVAVDGAFGLYRKLTIDAAKGADVVWGKALGPKPRFFVVGDRPVAKDFIVDQPFSGKLGDILTAAFVTLKEKYGAKPEDCYITYVVKADAPRLTEAEVMNDWLPAIQHEYLSSGCTEVVALGKMARALVGHISALPAEVAGPSIVQRFARAWEAFRG